MATTITATRQVVEDYQRLFVNRLAYTMQSMRPHPEAGRHYYFRPGKKRADLPLMLTALPMPTQSAMDANRSDPVEALGEIIQYG